MGVCLVAQYPFSFPHSTLISFGDFLLTEYSLMEFQFGAHIPQRVHMGAGLR